MIFLIIRFGPSKQKAVQLIFTSDNITLEKVRKRQKKQHFTLFANQYLLPSFTCFHIVRRAEHTHFHLFLTRSVPTHLPSFFFLEKSKLFFKKGAHGTVKQVVNCIRELGFGAGGDRGPNPSPAPQELLRWEVAPVCRIGQKGSHLHKGAKWASEALF